MQVGVGGGRGQGWTWLRRERSREGGEAEDLRAERTDSAWDWEG